MGPRTSASQTVIALIPAHNEAARIAAAIAGLRAQHHRPDRIVVVADNCSDATEDIAYADGAEVFKTYGNTHKKAGALNQALEYFVPQLHPDDLILIQDADTVIAPTFIGAARAVLSRKVPAVGGIFHGEEGGGLLGMLQRMEFHRYADDIKRKRNRADVLTGTGTLFRVGVLREVRRGRLAGRVGDGTSYYSLVSLTEDDEMTKAIKTLGYRTVSPPGCEVVTEVMPNLPKLWHQRIRWQRGALENLREYGLTKVTAPYVLRQLMMGFSCIALLLYLVLMALILVLFGTPSIDPFWASIGLIFMAEKVFTVRKAGLRAQLLAALIVVELVYDLFQHFVYFRSLYDMVLRRRERWMAT